MANTKRTTKRNQANRETGPKASRPHMPGYGIPKDKKGLLPWSHVTERMAEAQNYWVCTVSPDGRPHATPVWGLWVDDRLYFGGSPNTRRNRNLAENPAVCVHLESGSDVIIVHGDAQELRAPDRSLVTRLIEVSKSKYGYAPKPEDYDQTPGTYVLRPRWALAWSQGLKDATRWNFQDGD
ncbi:MAG TPA: pyridoxamine 5'-phosphate oxidase family protein [Blastocatellia bacterium]|nr:pyridoxamine 5'-phosphate oxidase family protein [Blastocatellia bacterium]